MDADGKPVYLFGFLDSFPIVNPNAYQSDNTLLPPGTRTSIVTNDKGKSQLAPILRSG